MSQMLFVLTFLFLIQVHSQTSSLVTPPADSQIAPQESDDFSVPPENETAADAVSKGPSENSSDSQVQAKMGDPLLEGFFEDLQYDPADKRDPFLPYFATAKTRLTMEQTGPQEPLQKFALGELKVIGIIWDVGRPKALVSDPGGKSYIITENSKVGKEFGYVAAIREGEVIVVEPIMDAEGKRGYQTKVLKLTK